mmetsp:Transcript_5848/g.19967  ORF Transcript_5848/g.19967 Transcript_5848/m.19967 type:complete len:494 (+) Transcript_5848:1195-2676(+)
MRSPSSPTAPSWRRATSRASSTSGTAGRDGPSTRAWATARRSSRRTSTSTASTSPRAATTTRCASGTCGARRRPTRCPRTARSSATSAGRRTRARRSRRRPSTAPSRSGAPATGPASRSSRPTTARPCPSTSGRSATTARSCRRASTAPSSSGRPSGSKLVRRLHERLDGRELLLQPRLPGELVPLLVARREAAGDLGGELVDLLDLLLEALGLLRELLGPELGDVDRSRRRRRRVGERRALERRRGLLGLLALPRGLLALRVAALRLLRRRADDAALLGHLGARLARLGLALRANHGRQRPAAGHAARARRPVGLGLRGGRGLVAGGFRALLGPRGDAAVRVQGRVRGQPEALEERRPIRFRGDGAGAVVAVDAHAVVDVHARRQGRGHEEAAAGAPAVGHGAGDVLVADLLLLVPVPEVDVAGQVAEARQGQEAAVGRPGHDVAVRRAEAVDLLRLEIVQRRGRRHRARDDDELLALRRLPLRGGDGPVFR